VAGGMQPACVRQRAQHHKPTATLKVRELSFRCAIRNAHDAQESVGTALHGDSGALLPGPRAQGNGRRLPLVVCVVISTTQRSRVAQAPRLHALTKSGWATGCPPGCEIPRHQDSQLDSVAGDQGDRVIARVAAFSGIRSRDHLALRGHKRSPTFTFEFRADCPKLALRQGLL